MNNKHLALLLLFLGIMGSMLLSQSLLDRIDSARQLRLDAEFALSQENTSKSMRNMAVEMLKQDSGAMRQYLNSWTPKLKETDDESKASNAFNRVLKQSQGLIATRNVGKILDVKDGTFITKRYESVVALEGEYLTAMTFLAQLEKQLPASRISSYSISKASRGDEVKFNFTFDTPVIAQAAVEAAPKL